MHFNGDQQITLCFNFWVGSFPLHPFGFFFFLLCGMIQNRKEKNSRSCSLGSCLFVILIFVFEVSEM